MPTISGKYKFNSTLPQLAEGEYPVTFTSNGGTFAKFAVEGSNFYYLNASNNGVNAYLFGINFWNSGEAYRDIDFGSTPQTISDTLYNYLVANAAKEETQTSFDLSTLNLPGGSHTITVKAKADGYRDSEASNAVTYTSSAFKQINLFKLDDVNYSSIAQANINKVYTIKDTTMSRSEIGINYIGVLRKNTSGSTPIWTADTVSGTISLELTISDSTNETTIVFRANKALPPYSGYQHDNYIALEGDTAATVADFANFTADSNANLVMGLYPAPTPCFVENTLISTRDGTKKVQDISYDDDILVWNFDEGKLDYAKPIFIKQEQMSDSYWHVTDEDGKTVNLVGSDGKSHRLYNKRTHLFEYPQDIPECKCEEIHESVKYYNIVTAYHFNCYANGILTSKRYSNMLYPITDEMKYDKTVKHINTCKREQFGFLTDDEFEKLRLSEMEYSDEMRDEVKHFFTLKK